MKRKVVIVAGGTGGHIYPAQSLARQMQKLDPQVDILFVGGGLKTNPYFDKAFPFQSVSCGRISKNVLKFAKNSYLLCKGVMESIGILRRAKPDLVVGFGSYYTFPTLIAAIILRIPIVLHAADSVPGKVIRLLSKYVVMTGIHFPQAASRLKGRTVEVAMPLKEGHRLGSIEKEQALHYFQLNPQQTTLLVFGGSQGAKAINQLIPQTLKNHQLPFQVIHITGSPQMSQELREGYLSAGIKACVKDFEHKMEYAYTAADLLIARSGASTVAEQIEFEVPGILIPYPFASDNHQDLNADFVCKQIGGAKKIREGELTAEKLAQEIKQVAQESCSMKQRFQSHKKSSQRQEFSKLLINMLNNH
jgi:UDP-N-acetylglucosamine--N-acetylmuramyl-(pentapeptide) pyrophosphoryl-undecaprenol N-acetylglucosamine transferase